MKLPPWLFFVLLGSLLLLPNLWSSSDRYGNIQFGPPRLTGGDEPYYMVIISSLLQDGDLDLRNNYEQALAGGWQAGKNFSGRPIGHHSCWYEGSKYTGWWAYYGRGEQERWQVVNNKFVPIPLVPGVEPSPNQPDYCDHPSGSAFAIMPVLFLAKPILSFFHRMDLVESLAILCSTFEIIGAAFFFWKLVSRYVANPNTAYIATALFFLGTSEWHYARSLFSEPLLVLCCIGAYSLILRGKSPILAGIFIGMGLHAKPFFLLLGVPLGIWLLWKKDFWGAVKLATPVGISGLIFLGLNTVMFGAPMHFSLQYEHATSWAGALGLLISPDHGLFAITPVGIMAVAAWPRFWRRYGAEAAVLLAAFAIYYIMIAPFFRWWGGFCYGTRYLIPVIPLFFLPLAYALENYTSLWTKALFWTLSAISILINWYSAFPYWASWGRNPLFMCLSVWFPGLDFPLRGNYQTGIFPLP